MTGDRHDFPIIDDFAESAGWLHTFMADGALYGFSLFTVVLLYRWRKFRRAGDSGAFADIVRAPLAAVIAVVLGAGNAPALYGDKSKVMVARGGQ